jgi:hypothetical protein
MHISETALDDYFAFDAIIDNDPEHSDQVAVKINDILAV